MSEKKVPEVRFKGFSGDWEKQLFDIVFDTAISNNTLSRANLNYEGGEYQNIHYGDILIKFGEITDVSKETIPYITNPDVTKLKSQLLLSGDVVFADAAEDETVGKATEVLGIGEKKIVSGLHTIPVRPKKLKPVGYLGYYMNSNSYHRQLLPLMQGIKVLSISKRSLATTKLTYPALEQEQAKIGEFFKNLDTLIALNQSKYDKLVNMKKACLDKMFPKDGADIPEVRFKGFSGGWETCKFGETVDRYEEPVQTPNNGYMRLGIRSHAKGTFHSYVEKGRELQTAKMHKVAAGNFIVNITFGWEHAVAITDENDRGKLVSHRFPQFKFREGMIPIFFKCVILEEKFKHHLSLSSPGGAGRNRVLKLDEMLEYKITFPCEKEQTKIGNFFQSLDNLITLRKTELEKLKNVKKACLDKMFI